MQILFWKVIFLTDINLLSKILIILDYFLNSSKKFIEVDLFFLSFKIAKLKFEYKYNNLSYYFYWVHI